MSASVLRRPARLVLVTPCNRRCRPTLCRELCRPSPFEEAAKVLRIGQGTAYAMARRWRETNGREGLPVIVLGRSLRFPRAGLDRLLHDLARPVPAHGVDGVDRDAGR